MLRLIGFLSVTMLLLGPLIGQSGDSWASIQEKGEGILVCHWFPNDVEVADSKDIIDGIERDLTQAFIKYLESTYGVSIQLDWVKAESFGAVLSKVKDGSGGTFGASSISITADRARHFNFTEPYMADVSVLMSSANMPVALTEEELRTVIGQCEAVSIQNTTLLESLKKLRDTLEADFEIQKVGSSGSVIREIAKRENTFGYVDIVNFLIALENGENVRRQFFFPVKLEGLALIYSKNSDWDVPVGEYFQSDQFKKDRQQIVTRYLGADASQIIDQISRSAEMGPLQEIVLSHREREAQYAKLLEAAERDKEVSKLNLVLKVVSFSAVVIMGLIFYLYHLKSKNNTQLVDQQRTIEQQNEQLTQINEEKNNLIQVLAHDLRSPLSNILNAAVLLQSNPETDDSQKQLISFITQSSEKMNVLIDKIMDVDAIETGKKNLQMEAISVRQIVEQVVSAQSSNAEDKGIEIVQKLKPELKVNADKVYLSQILENLLSNAIKYSEEKTEILFQAEPLGDRVRFSVADQGPGLTEEDKRKVFMKYQRLSAKPTKGELSIGLGLSIVKLFTERLGGEVSFDTTYGEGTTFHIDLPVSSA